MRGGRFPREALPSHDLRMAEAKTDEALSDVCREIEARLIAEGASVEDWTDYEAIRDTHVRRVLVGGRAG